MNCLDKNLYPFESKFIEIDDHKLHYVDEGSGEVILFVHGTPEWSFGYRDLIKGLSNNYRCIAFDHLGFGFSDKPEDADYTTKKHSERLTLFINKLKLENINIVANDFGGSIALAYAINHGDNVNRICLFNTWMWSLNNDKHFSRPATIMHTMIGKLLYKKLNFPVNILLPQAYADKSKLTKNIHNHYKEPLSKPEYRNGTYTFAKEILDAGPWWDSLWADLDKLDGKSFLIMWGMKDKLILPKELDKWTKKLPSAKVVRFENSGHFLQEEEPEKMISEIQSFLRQQ